MRFISALILLILILSCQKRRAEITVPETADIPSPAIPTASITPTVIITPTISATPTLGLEIGDIAYDLNLADTDSIPVSLASLKGKLVLIDFWASWCKPCKIENRNLSKLYPVYMDAEFKTGKGFEIYSVSIDDARSKKGWLACIANEKYTWKFNVIDEGGAAEWRYNIKSVPQNYLIDRNGIIIAKNLRDSLVEKTLIGLLKSSNTKTQ